MSDKKCACPPVSKALQPLVESLGRTLSLLLDDGAEICILEYANRQIFEYLWMGTPGMGSVSATDLQINWSDPRTVVIVLGDDPPEAIFRNLPPSLSRINLQTPLRASSWAAAWRLRFPDSPAKVLLLEPSIHDQPDVVSVALDQLFSARRTGGESLVPGLSRLVDPARSGVCGAWRACRTAPRPAGSGTASLLRSTIWDGLTSDRDGSHAISNVIGSLLLSWQVGFDRSHGGPPWVQDFLLSLVQACGLTATGGQVRLEDHDGFQAWVSGDLLSQVPSVLLIDDMADLWGFFLRAAFGMGRRTRSGKARPGLRSFIATNGEDFFEQLCRLPERLNEFLSSGRETLTSADLAPGGDPHRDRFVLFLDLRLFPPSLPPALEHRRANFHRALAQVGLDVLRSGRPLSWLDADGRSRLEREFAAVIGSKAGGEAALPPAETILPRVLSLLDPTLPIIIFSSTHRTEVIEPLREFGNLITGFRKPVLATMSGDWAASVRDLRDDFLAAVRRAIRILRSRDVISTVRARAVTPTPHWVTDHPHGYLIEVFHDESEHPRRNLVCSGGIVVLRPLSVTGEPLVSDRGVLKKLQIGGCTWGWCADMEKNTWKPNRAMPKGSGLEFGEGGDGVALLEKMVRKVRSAIGNDAQVFPFALIARRRMSTDAWMKLPSGVGKTRAEGILDRTLHVLIRHALEGILFRSRLLRPALETSGSQVAIDLGIRHVPCKRSDELLQAFGVDTIWRDPDRFRVSLQSEDGFTIASEVCGRTGMRWPYPAKIVRSRAVPLYDYGQNDQTTELLLPKQLHYFADAIAHVALHHQPAATGSSDLLKGFFDSGWIVNLEEDKKALRRFEIGRKWDQGDCATALVEAAALPYGGAGNGFGIELFGEIHSGLGRVGAADLSRLLGLPDHELRGRAEP